MFNKKILKMLDCGDVFIQKTEYGATLHYIGENLDKEDENGRLNSYALKSVSFTLENDDSSPNLKDYDSMWYHIRDTSSDGDNGIKIKTYNKEDSILREELKDWQKYGADNLEEILREFGYEKVNSIKMDEISNNDVVESIMKSEIERFKNLPEEEAKAEARDSLTSMGYINEDGTLNMNYGGEPQ